MPRVTLTVSYSLLGQIEKAKIAAENVLKIDPKLRVDGYTAFMPYKRKEDVDKVAYALRLAGLPE